MLHGILNIYKEKGYTSHDVVAKLRGIVGQKKIGHTGTLDPDEMCIRDSYMELGEGIYEEEVYEEGYGDEFDETYEEEEFEK